MKHIMIDIETFGTRPGCVVRSIGAKEFTPVGSKGEDFYVNLESDTQIQKGLYIDRDTVKWWETQSKESQKRLTEDQKDTYEALWLLKGFFDITGAEFAWSHGAGFDLVLLEYLYWSFRVPTPWLYKNARDTRTIFDLTGLSLKSIPREGIHHDALDDAFHQVKVLQKAYRKLREGVKDE